MPMFAIQKKTLTPISKTNFNLEKDLQRLVEGNLGAVFNCRFVASEFVTGQVHAGRIDTLSLSEENNPVIIEYKKVESSELVTQSLFYLNWIYDHKGDYEIAVQSALGNDVKVDWSDVRVICIAPNYRKYDLHAVQMIGANIELWSYRLFENSTLYFEQVYGKSDLSMTESSVASNGKNPVMVAAGKKAALTRATGIYTFKEHIENRPEKIKDLAIQIQEHITGLDPAMKENPKKLYVGYKTSQNIVCMELRNQKIILYLKLNPETLDKMPKIGRDVTNVGHYGTGDLSLTIRNEDNLEIAKPYIEMAYKRLGG